MKKIINTDSNEEEKQKETLDTFKTHPVFEMEMFKADMPTGKKIKMFASGHIEKEGFEDDESFFIYNYIPIYAMAYSKHEFNKYLESKKIKDKQSGTIYFLGIPIFRIVLDQPKESFVFSNVELDEQRDTFDKIKSNTEK